MEKSELEVKHLYILLGEHHLAISLFYILFIGVSSDGFYVIRDFSGISAWVWEFYSMFRLSFWSHFQDRGWVVYVVLASLSRDYLNYVLTFDGNLWSCYLLMSSGVTVSRKPGTVDTFTIAAKTR